MKLEKELEILEKEYLAKVEIVAERLFKEIVVPYCNKYYLDFINGNGTWAFFFTALTPKSYINRTRRGSVARGVPYSHADIDLLPKRIVRALDTPVMWNNNNLNLFMMMVVSGLLKNMVS